QRERPAHTRSKHPAFTLPERHLLDLGALVGGSSAVASLAHLALDGGLQVMLVCFDRQTSGAKAYACLFDTRNGGHCLLNRARAVATIHAFYDEFYFISSSFHIGSVGAQQAAPWFAPPQVFGISDRAQLAAPLHPLHVLQTY